LIGNCVKQLVSAPMTSRFLLQKAVRNHMDLRLMRVVSDPFSIRWRLASLGCDGASR